MALTNSDMRRFAELGASLEIVTFVTEILERDKSVTRRDGKAMTPAERARRYREKHKPTVTKSTVTPRDEIVTEANFVFPEPLSSSLKSPVIIEVIKGFEESKGVEIAREGELFNAPTVTNGNVTKRDVTKRGTIMPEDFFPAANVWNDPEISNLTEHEKQIELQAMKDWSASRTGSKGKMLDWDRFARGWLRRHAKERKQRNGNHQAYSKPPTRADGFAQVRAVIEEAERRELENSGAAHEENALRLPGLR